MLVNYFHSYSTNNITYTFTVMFVIITQMVFIVTNSPTETLYFAVFWNFGIFRIYCTLILANIYIVLFTHYISTVSFMFWFRSRFRSSFEFGFRFRSGFRSRFRSRVRFRSTFRSMSSFRSGFRSRIGSRVRSRLRFKFGSVVVRWGSTAGRWCVDMTVQLY